MAETEDAIHVSFLGTKLPADHLTNLNLGCEPGAGAIAGPIVA